MAKHTTTQCRKFKKALRTLGIPGPHLLGHLEYLWQSAHLEGNPVFADADDVEIAAEWSGEPRTLATALIDAGWLDLRDDGQIEVHDYWEHAPKYVQERERQRVKRKTNKRQQIPTNSNKSPTTSNKRQQTTKSCQLLDTTYTDTEPIPNQTADTEEGLRSPHKTRARGGKPERLHINPSAFCKQDGIEDYLERIQAVTHEEHWVGWWRDVVHKMAVAGILDAFLGILEYVEDCCNAETRQRKDLGELQHPGRYLVDKAQALCREHALNWPKFPKEVTSA